MKLEENKLMFLQPNSSFEIQTDVKQDNFCLVLAWKH